MTPSFSLITLAGAIVDHPLRFGKSKAFKLNEPNIEPTEDVLVPLLSF